MIIVAKKFVIGFSGTLALGLVIWIGCFLFQMGAVEPSTEWMRLLWEKKTAAAHAAVSPKLVIAGGSNTLFGLKAERMQRTLGIPVVNMGIQAGLNGDYLFKRIKDVTNPGDCVLMVLEYNAVDPRSSSVNLDPSLTEHVLSNDLGYFRELPLAVKLKWFFAYPPGRLWERMKYKAHPKPVGDDPDAYRADTVNMYGDETRHRREDQSGRMKKKIAAMRPAGYAHRLPGAEWKMALRSFVKWGREHGVRMVLAYPAFMYFEEYRTPPLRTYFEEVERFYRGLGVEVIGSPFDSMYPRDDFFDTNYHLTYDTAVRRTDALAERLCTSGIR